MKGIANYSAYNKPPDTPEDHFGPSKVEPGESIPLKHQIERFMLAGQRLAISRVGYEFPAGTEVPEGYYDRTRDPDFDMADASTLAGELRQRLKEKADAAREANRTVPETPEGAPENPEPPEAGG